MDSSQMGKKSQEIQKKKLGMKLYRERQREKTNLRWAKERAKEKGSVEPL